MAEQAQTRKRWIRWGIVALLALDVLLLITAWRIGREKDLTDALERLRIQHGLLAADVGRARDIRNRLPDVRLQGQRFYKDYLRSAAGGYPAMVADLSQIAQKSGLRASTVSYKQKEISQHGLVEIDVSTTVEGDYQNLVRFINGLERSKNFYLLRDVALVSGASGLKLTLELRTYFRS